jgi:hypothetical protein
LLWHEKLAPWLIGFVLIGWAAVKMLLFPVWQFQEKQSGEARLDKDSGN